MHLTKPKNAFDCSIIHKLGNDYDVRTKRNKFKTQYLVKIKEKDAETHLLKFLKENIKPDEQYGIYFENKDLQITTCKILKNHFNKRLKLIKTNIHTPSIYRNNFEHVIESEVYVIENHKKIKKKQVITFLRKIMQGKRKKKLSNDSDRTLENKETFLKSRRQ